MSKKFTPTPHDAVFRQFLSEKETAKDFFDIWLPDEIRYRLAHHDEIAIFSSKGMPDFKTP